ncbi:hypothetical protein [Rugosimonospora africana]|uniref:Uncharacterized protein n=1 Tax=Rugosimonospora africana TaxID=556532 RepID=A0A8J3QYJ4_9ACTN|nr:hypothetical protein [Rugosimonospora africana]GIH17016.1 hypothetical protein Raf01_51880 [Rugosimonospora africana]
MRLLSASVAAILTVIAIGVGLPTGAWAADQPNSLAIGGPGLKKPITVRAAGQQDLFNTLMRQVSWMAGQQGDPINPDPAKLGAKYTLTVFVNNAAAQVYELYPQAPGGPRAHRPAAQPKGSARNAWFYASVAMPDALAAAGVTLPHPDASGAAQEMIIQDPNGFAPAEATSQPISLGIDKTLRDQGRTLLLWLATPFVVLLLLFAAARRSRRYVAR